jgi:hypothetical protein
MTIGATSAGLFISNDFRTTQFSMNTEPTATIGWSTNNVRGRKIDSLTEMYFPLPDNNGIIS